MKVNQRTRTHSKFREPWATKARDDRFQAIRRSRTTGRDNFIDTVRQYRAAGRTIFYTDEAWLNKNMTTYRSWNDGTSNARLK